MRKINDVELNSLKYSAGIAISAGKLEEGKKFEEPVVDGTFYCNGS